MPTESTYPQFDVPNADLWAFLFERNDRPFPDNKVIYRDAETDRNYTYDQVKTTAIDFGKGLKSVWEWRKGDVLALFTPNCIDTPAIIWGCHWAGGNLSPANPGYTVEELAFQLKDAGAKAIVTQKPFLVVAQDAARRVGIPEDRIILIGDERDEARRFKHFTAIRNLAGTSRYRRTKLDPKKDLAFLVYSSGTTGHPKGVMLSHENIVSNILMLKAGEAGNLTWDGGSDGQGDNLLAFLPFFHIYGLTCLIHQSLYSGLTLVVMPKFDMEKFCATIQRHKITFAYVVPPVVLLLGKHPVVDKYDLSSLRMMNSGAAPLTQELVEAVHQRLKVPIKQGYGLSETSPTTHTQPWETWNKTIGSVGLLLPNQTAKYMSPDEKEVSVGEVGELWIKGPNVFLGYHNNPEGTKNALTEDGYFKTGDVGYQDQDGNFYITDRVKELIKYKGFQVAPAELEGLLVSHPKINDVAIVGVYDKEQATEVPRAYIVPRPGVEGNKATVDDIIAWLQGKVANHKRLRGGVRFVEEIPKSASGKILRRLLKIRAQEEEGKGLKAKL
ncbi:4-coumarate--coA ligase 1 [Physcia stellaris]|nr:4-coumarate--coA ligase 1 [Physcia stellaris]